MAIIRKEDVRLRYGGGREGSGSGCLRAVRGWMGCVVNVCVMRGCMDLMLLDAVVLHPNENFMRRGEPTRGSGRRYDVGLVDAWPNKPKY